MSIKLTSQKLLAAIIAALTIATLSFSSTASACDDKACEAAYLANAQRYADNQIRHDVMFRAERLAHAKNRERRALALYMHIHQVRFGRYHHETTVDKKPLVTKPQTVSGQAKPKQIIAVTTKLTQSDIVN